MRRWGSRRRRTREPIAGVLVPGFVDLHVHGGAGADFMDGSVEAVRARLRLSRPARHGGVGGHDAVGRPRRGDRRGRRGSRGGAAPRAPGEARVAGIHLEGPYLNPAKAGAQDPAALRAADRDEVEEWLAAAGELPVAMTVAPEVAGVLEADRGSSPAASPSRSVTPRPSEELTRRALAAGACRFTHLWNAMPALHHRRPGVVGAALAAGPDVILELIADGRHVHPLLLAASFRAAPRRVALVTDAMRAAGMPDGRYALARLEVEVREGGARLPSGALAGSLLTMDAALRAMVLAAGVRSRWRFPSRAMSRPAPSA